MPLAPASPRKNFVKIRPCCSRAIPRPSSRTLIRTESLYANAFDVDPPALRGVLDRVREEVADDLREPLRIAPYGQRALEVELEAVPGALPRVELPLIVHQRGHVDELLRQLEPPRLDLLHVEEVLEQRGEPARLGVDDPEVVPSRVDVELTLEQQRREADHAGERRPQLVRDDADQLALQALALAQLRVLPLELGVVCLQARRHLVEGARELTDLARAGIGQAKRELASGEAARSRGDPAHGACDRAREVDAEEHDQQGRRDDPEAAE